MNCRRNSPPSNLNNKNNLSQEDLGSEVILGLVDQSASSLPTTTIAPSSRGITTNTVNTMSSSGMRDDTSITSSGCGSLTKKKHTDSMLMEPSSLLSSIVTDSGISELSEPGNAISDTQISVSSYAGPMQVNVNGGGTHAQQSALSTHTTTNAVNNSNEQGHSRNSSNTSQVSGRILGIGIHVE